MQFYFLLLLRCMIEKWRGKKGEEKKEEGENTADLIYHKKVIEPPFLIRKFGVSEEAVSYTHLTLPTKA